MNFNFKFKSLRSLIFNGIELFGLRRYCNSDTTKNQYMKGLYTAVNEPDYGQETNNPYILAKRHIVSGKSTDLHTLNSILAFHKVHITQQEFDILKGIVPTLLPYPLPQANKDIISVIGKANINSDKTVGAYVLTYLPDSSLYVGGTKDMAKRPRYYYSSKGLVETRKIAKLMATQGPSSFNLNVYVINPDKFIHLSHITDSYLTSLVLALEQYLILELKPSLNEVLVVGGVSTALSGSVALAQIAAKKMKPVYIYNADMTRLLYISKSRMDLAKDIGINQVTINRYLTSGGILYNTYVFSNLLLDTATVSLVSILELRDAMALLYKKRMQLRDYSAKVNSNIHPIKLTDLESPDKASLCFVSKSQARQYTEHQGRPIYEKHFKRILPFKCNGWLVESGVFK